GLVAAQLRRPTTARRSARARGQHRDHGDLVDQRRHLRPLDRGRAQRAGYRDQVPNRLAALGAGVPDIDTRTHPVEHTQHASARRIEAYTGNVRTGRAQQAECEQERGGREVAGNVEVEWPQRRNRLKGHTHTLAVLGRLDRRTLRGKHPLRVIAREAWLAHRNGHSAHEPRQEERTLYLRARVRGVEADRLEASAAHTYRPQASLAQVLEARTHPCEGL